MQGKQFLPGINLNLLRCLLAAVLLVATFGLDNVGTMAQSMGTEFFITNDSPDAGNALATKRVGIQVGHWETDDVPDELAALRGNWGAVVGNLAEVDVNLDIGKRVAYLLEAQGITVDLIPVTVPPGYRGDAFVALHVDEYSDPQREGYKIARASASAIPRVDDALAQAISQEYKKATNMVSDPLISDDMTDYYVFNYRRFNHAIAPSTPAVILEMGFLTNPSDRQILVGSQDLLADAIARGIIRFLSTQ